MQIAEKIVIFIIIKRKSANLTAQMLIFAHKHPLQGVGGLFCDFTLHLSLSLQ